MWGLTARVHNQVVLVTVQNTDVILFRIGLGIYQ